MWKDFGVKCVNWNTFCILDEYPRAGVDALNGCKIVHKCTNATVIVHIYMVTITHAFNILVFFGSVEFVREKGSE